MALVPASRTHRFALLGGVALTTVLTACGGSLVPPDEFVGATGQASGVSNSPGTVAPDGTTTDPGTGTDPGTTTDQPGTTTGNPGTSTGQPGTTTGNPGTSTGKPGTTTGKPGTTTSGQPSAGGPLAGVRLGNCAGLKNGSGITASQIDLATIADRSGAVADTFKAAHDGMNAYVAYFNSSSSICGRKLKLQTYDSGLTATGSNDSSKSACAQAFALVGSFSAFDSGGADVTARCGQPDIRASAVESARQRARTTVQVSPIDTRHIFLQPWVWAKQKFPTKIKKAAYVYLNAGASGTISNAIIKGTTRKLGYNWRKTIVVDIAGVPNWNAYANQLKAAGIEFVQTNLADYTSKLRAAFNQANYHPTFVADASFYGPRYLANGGAKIMNGAYSFSQTALLEEASKVPELALAVQWIQRTGGDPSNITAMQAWAAGYLFTHKAAELGGKLNRASLLAALRTVHSFNGNRIITPTNPGSGTTAPCVTVVQVQGNRFVRITPYPYTCGPLA